MNKNEKKILIDFMLFLTRGKFYKFDMEITLKEFDKYLKKRNEI